MLTLTALLATLVLGAPQSAGIDPSSSGGSSDVPAPHDTEKDSGFDVLGVPLFNYNTDTGFGFGALGTAYFYSAGHRPYAHAITAQTYITTFGIQSHYLSYDGPGLLGPFRVEGHVEYHRELYAPFYGLGNDSSPGGLLDTNKKVYGYLSTVGTFWARTRVHPLGDRLPLQLYAGYQYATNGVTAYPGSVLSQVKPTGWQGGRNPYFYGGVLWDARDDEVDTTQGWYAEGSVRISRREWWSQFNYQGVTLDYRRFFPIFTPRIVFGFNVAADQLWGPDIPFWELSNFGGIAHYEGLGGMATVRGVPRDRFQGDTKLFGSAELRFYAIEFEAWGATMKLGGIGFFDAGRVWQPGAYNGSIIDPPQWHSGTGGGIRLARRAAVLRADYSVEIATNRRAFYFTFGQTF